MKIAVNGNAEIDLAVPHGSTVSPVASTRFIKTNYQEDLLADIMQTYAVADFCLIGKQYRKVTKRIDNINCSLQVPREVESLP